jgi:tetratricopeptide (TPR) repeat protein
LDRLRKEAFALAYNLDHAEAQALLEKALAADPRDPVTHRSLASLAWLHILFVRGAITVDQYLGAMTKPRVEMQKPAPELDAQFHDHLRQALDLGRAMTQARPRDVQALYDYGAAQGLQASYMASVEGRLTGGLGAARGAFHAEERVLELDPPRKDAGLIVGTYRYLVSSLSFPLRWMAYLAGFGGGKEQGIRMIQEAAAYNGDSRVEARFALILIFNRERRYDEAMAVIRELQREFPRNRLLDLEYGGTALRAGRAADAEAALTRGIERLKDDARPRAGAELAMWHYKRGAARVRLGRLDESGADLTAALASSPPMWIRGRVQVELGKTKDLRGDRRGATELYRQAADLCERDRDPLCASEARALMDKGYNPANRK